MDNSKKYFIGEYVTEYENLSGEDAATAESFKSIIDGTKSTISMIVSDLDSLWSPSFLSVSFVRILGL